MKDKLLSFGFAAILFFGLLAQLIIPDRDISYTERRKLSQLPKVSSAALLDGSFFRDFETYALDQLPLRDALRSVKAVFRKDFLGVRDQNGIFVEDGAIYKMLYPENAASIDRAGELCAFVLDIYFADNPSFFAVIPDRSFYSPASLRPRLDYDKLLSRFGAKLPQAKEIAVLDALDLDCYYRTDPHWEQSRLLPLSDRLLSAMDNSYLPSADSYAENTLSPFYGSYYHQAALPYIAPDELKYLNSAAISACTVLDAESGKIVPVYEPDRFSGIDPYDVFLGGAKAILTIENPNAETDRTLCIFRDSFASALAPLLAGGYSKLILIDLRYVSASALSDYVEIPDDSEVLFLFSEMILNQNVLGNK